MQRVSKMSLDEMFSADIILMLKSQLEKTHTTHTELNNRREPSSCTDSLVQ